MKEKGPLYINPLSCTNLLGYTWGVLLCPLSYSFVDQRWEAACILSVITAGVIALWIGRIRGWIGKNR